MNPYAAPISPEDENRTAPAFQMIAAKSARWEGFIGFPVLFLAFRAPQHFEVLKGHAFDSIYFLLSAIVGACFVPSLVRRFFLSRLRKDICQYPIVRSGEALLGGPVNSGWPLRGRGYLFLTRRELIYSLRNGRWDDEKSFRIPFSEIESVARARRFFLNQNAILIHLRSGKVQRFSTSDPVTWIEGIVGACRMLSA